MNDNPISGAVDTVTPRRSGRFTDSVVRFKAVSEWLDDSHAPALAALEGAAEELDRRFTGATLSQFNSAFRMLRDAAPERVPDKTGGVDDIVAEARA